MLTFIAALLIAAMPGSDCAQISVHDGDTIRCDGERVRILDIDAPELASSPRCTDRRRTGWCDDALARRSRDALAEFLASGPVRIERRGKDRYGRTLAMVWVGDRGAGRHLIALGLATEWR